VALGGGEGGQGGVGGGEESAMCVWGGAIDWLHAGQQVH
jgi:hypothetical protein